MISAMEWKDQEPVLIEDLIKMGQDDGWDDGFGQGFEQAREEGLNALRATVVAVIEARGLPLDEEQRARIAAEQDMLRLTTWARRAAVASDARSALSS